MATSTTIITQPQTQYHTLSNISLLADYQIHHSNGSSVTTGAQRSSRLSEQSRAEHNPEEWEASYRRVPDYRRVNRALDYNERPAGLNTAEYCFIQTMLQGVRLMANINTLWRSTAGKINDGIFHYQIGGEF